MDAKKRSSRAGQSVIEFCIGLVGLLTVVAGIFQLGTLGLFRTSMRVEATETVAYLTMNDFEDPIVLIPPYISEIELGDDERAYSVDDERSIFGVNEAYQQLAEDNRSNLLRAYLQDVDLDDNDMAQINNAEDMHATFGLVRGTAVESNIPILPIVRKLFFSQPTVDIESEVWSVRTGGLY